MTWRAPNLRPSPPLDVARDSAWSSSVAACQQRTKMFTTLPGPGLKGKGGLGAPPQDKPYYAGDLESGPDALYPGISVSEQGLRWGFIQKARRTTCG